MYLLSKLDFPNPTAIFGYTKEEIVQQFPFEFDTEHGILYDNNPFNPYKQKTIRHYRVNLTNDPNSFTKEEVYKEVLKDALQHLIKNGWMLFKECNQSDQEQQS